MKQNNPWTKEEIERMQHDFSQGHSIKVMAKNLGRSETSLNKALSRFGARGTKPDVRYIKWNPHAPYCKDKLPPIIEYKTVHPKKQKTLPSAPSQKQPSKIQKKTDIWVPFSKIIHYVQSKGALIETFHLDQDNRPSAYRDAMFFLNKKPCSALKVVLFANKLRAEERKPAFLAKEVTW